VTIEDLERGMKIRWDAHVHSADRLGRIEVLQEKAELEMAELRASERTMLDGLASLARVVTNIGEAQARTEASVAALSEDVQTPTKRMDAFIAALHNGRQTQQ